MAHDDDRMSVFQSNYLNSEQGRVRLLRSMNGLPTPIRHLSIPDWVRQFTRTEPGSGRLPALNPAERGPGDDVAVFSINGRLQAAAPFKANHHALLLCTAGGCRQTVGLHTFALEVGSFMLYTPGLINAFEQVSDDFAAYLILFQQPFLTNGFLKEAVIDELLYVNPEYKPVFTVDSDYLPVIGRKFADAAAELQHRNAFHLNMIRLLILELLYEFNRVCEHCLLQAPKRMNRQYQLTHQFKHLVESGFVYHKTVAAYANQMNVSVKYLSEIVKQETGLPALDIIHNRLLLEAQYLLSHTGLSVKEITDQLGFDTPSHFARFFRHKLNITPHQYRLA